MTSLRTSFGLAFQAVINVRASANNIYGWGGTSNPTGT
jgi:hypothetical protein